MFKNRKVTIQLDKVDKGEGSDTTIDPEAFEKKADHILQKLERLGAKAFFGLCIYVVLDTHRQATVAKAIYHPKS